MIRSIILNGFVIGMGTRHLVSLCLLLFGMMLVAGCATQDPTISKEEQETTRQHKKEYEEKTGF